MNIACKICGSDENKVWYRLNERNIIRCRSCGFAWTQFSSKVKIDEMYDESYFTDVHSSYFRDCRYDYIDREKKSPKLKRFRQYVDLVKKFHPGGNILDSGCATGVFLHMLKREGYSVQGLDISKFASEYAGKHFGISVQVGTFESAILSKKPDAITMWDFLEHVENPEKVVEKVAKLLPKGGHYFVMTTNESSLMSYLARLFYVVGFGKWPFKLPAELIYPKHHLHFFTEKTLRKLLERNGFKIRYKEKSEMPLATIEGGFLMRICAAVLYTASNLLYWQHEIMFVAEKQ